MTLFFLEKRSLPENWNEKMSRHQEWFLLFRFFSQFWVITRCLHAKLTRTKDLIVSFCTFMSPRLDKAIAPLEERAPTTAFKVDPNKVTDVFFDFDGTLTASNQQGVSGYVLPLLEKCRDLRVSDCIEEAQIFTWKDLDHRMASAVLGNADLDFSDTSVLGALETCQELQKSMEKLTSLGIGIHILTMGTPQTCKALLAAGGYNLSLFQSFLGPVDMANNQSLKHLFDNGDADGKEAAESFEFDVAEDIDALHHLQKTGEQNSILQRIMSMDRRLSKADLIISLVGKGGVLVDDNFAKNIFDADAKGVMYIHVNPEGVLHTSAAIHKLADLLAKRE